MSKSLIAAFLAICATGVVLAQPPRTLPSSLDDPARDRPLSPADAAKQRENAIAALKEEIVSFDPTDVSASEIEGRWKLHTRTVMLKDFGTDRATAAEAVRIVKDLRFNQLGKIPGAQPPFEYWLHDGKAPRGVNSRITVVPIAARTVRAESVGGTWAVTDGAKGLYDFGTDEQAAKRAAIVFWKYGFNQVGLVGAPRPSMLYPLLDPRQATVDKTSPLPNPSPLGVMGDVSRTSLLLPGNIYAGPKSAIDVKKLETVRTKTGEYTLTYNGDVLAKFGSTEHTARAALKVLTDAHVNEIARLGDCSFPLFLTDGLPIHSDPLGVTKTAFRAERLKLQKLRDTYWLFDDIHPLLEVGSKADAELLLKVIRQYDLKCLCLFGRPEAGGLRLLTMGR